MLKHTYMRTPFHTDTHTHTHAHTHAHTHTDTHVRIHVRTAHGGYLMYSGDIRAWREKQQDLALSQPMLPSYRKP